MDGDGVRPTATRQRVATWAVELSQSAWGLAAAYLPFVRAISSRSREQVVLAVTEVNGCRYTAWIHGAWSEFLGDEAADDALDLLLDHARASALAGRPVDSSHLEGRLPPDAVRAVRATVAVAELSSLVGNTVDALADRLRGRRPLDLGALAGEVAVVALGLPVAAPLLAAAGAMRLASRLSPPLPEIVCPPDDEANLVVAMLAEAIPTYLANALVRALVLAAPRPVVLGVRAEDTSATVRISRDAIELSNGLAHDVAVVVDGGLDLLLDVAGRALDRDLTRLTVR